MRRCGLILPRERASSCRPIGFTPGQPKIGPDLGKLARARPGTAFSFAAVSIGQAVAARREEAALLARGILVEPLVRTHLSSEFLLGLNLIDGVVGLDAIG
jgi:hypothetical protein